MTGAGPSDDGAVAPAPGDGGSGAALQVASPAPRDDAGRAIPPDRPVTLRPARAGDAAALARIETATSTRPWTEVTFLTELAHPDRSYVVACDGQFTSNGEVVGYAGLGFFAGDAHVMGIAVLPSAQGRGCGRALLTAVCRAAAEADAAMTLEVRPSNAVARHLYRSSGFIEAGRRPGYYPDGEDALILWRHVRDNPGPAATDTASTPAGGPATVATSATTTAPTAQIAMTLTTDGG